MTIVNYSFIKDVENLINNKSKKQKLFNIEKYIFLIYLIQRIMIEIEMIIIINIKEKMMIKK